MNTLQRITHFSPAFDHGDRGHHGVNMYLVVRGEKGAVSLTIYTEWQLYPSKHTPLFSAHSAGLHWHKATTEGFPCAWTDTGFCQGDLSFTQGNELFTTLIEKGDDVWIALEDLYEETL